MKILLAIIAVVIAASFYIQKTTPAVDTTASKPNSGVETRSTTNTPQKSEVAQRTEEQTSEDFKKWQEIIDKGRHSWSVSEQRSPIDDSTNVYLTLSSDEEIRGRFGRPGYAKMVVRCKENTSTVYFRMNNLFLADIQSYGNVVTRLDKDKARTYRMKESTDNEALGLWRGGTAIPFIKSLFDHDKLLVQITPYNESPVIATFNIKNLRKAIEPMRKACNW